MDDNNQSIHNQEAFKLYKAKGYTKPYHENEYGWFDLSVEDIKKETIYEKGSDEITISIVHLPNDKWIATSTVNNNANNKIISIVKNFLFTSSEAEMSLFSFLDCQ